MEVITKFEKKVFNYLNELRASAQTNMFAAAPYLMEEFGIDKHEAKEVLTKWMHNFNDAGYDDIPVREDIIEAAYQAGFVSSVGLDGYNDDDPCLFNEAQEFLTNQALRD